MTVRIFNPDGSEAEKSGNGLRIFAKYLFEHRYVQDKSFQIATAGGLVEVEVQDETANMIRLDMGMLSFDSSRIPMRGRKREVVDEPLQIGDGSYRVTCASIGNPHCVIPMDQISEAEARRMGPAVENHEAFPQRINMQLLRVIDRGTIEIRIWERGAGYTLASGSSACAAAGAAHKLGLVDGAVQVRMPGGTLDVEIRHDWEVFLTGPVQGVCTGSLHTDLAGQLCQPDG